MNYKWKKVLLTHILSSFKDVIFQWLTTNEIRLNSIDAEDPEVSNLEYSMLLSGPILKFLYHII